MTPLLEDGFLRLKITSKEKIARDIWRFELTDPQGAPLPRSRRVRT